MQEKLKAIYRSQDTLPKLIEDESVPSLNMDEYYVKLQMLMSSGSGDKQDIEVTQIFSDVSGKVAPRTVLITGKAGIGKTTFLHHLAYKWGKEGAFSERFDYVFTVKLKKLLSVSGDFGGRKPLAELIKISLEDQQTLLEQQFDDFKRATPEEFDKFLADKGLTQDTKENMLADITTEEISEVLKGQKVLLLLDGYDEVASLDKSNHVVGKIMLEIRGGKYNVVVTSRPNALNSQTESRFDRKIETTGLNLEAAYEYIHTYFSKQQDRSVENSLTGLIKENPALREVVTTPINVAMLCLISADPDVRGKFGGEFNVGQLYQESILWLGKRYKQKYSDTDIENVSMEAIFGLEVVTALKKVAYEEFSNDRISIEGNAIDGYSTTVGTSITEVNKFGLLRPEGGGKSATDLLGRNHAFIHLSFQEYLTAYSLKEKLVDADEQEARKAAEFIAEHRSEPRYLMTLKFLAGLVSNEQEPEILVHRFWEAAVCNVDGVLELGEKSKATLLMHLLSQAKIKGQVDTRIPNRERIIEFIDKLVLKDFLEWGEVLKQTDYLSDNMKGEIGRFLQEWSQPAKVEIGTLPQRYNSKAKKLIEIISNAINKLAPQLAPHVILEGIHEIAEKDGWQVKAAHLRAIEDIFRKTTVDIQFAHPILERITPFIFDENLKLQASKSMQSVIDAYSSSPSNQAKLKDNLRDDIINFILVTHTHKLEILFLREGSVTAVTLVQRLLHQLSDGDYDVRAEAAGALGEIAKTSPALIDKAGLLTKLIDESWEVRAGAAGAFREIAKTSPALIDKAGLITKLSDESWEVRAGAAGAFREIAKTSPALIDQEIAAGLLTLLSDGDDPHGYVRASAAKTLGEIAKTSPALIDKAGLLTKLIDKDWRVRAGAARALGEIAKTSPALIDQEIAAGLLTTLSDGDEDVRAGAAHALGAIAKTSPALIDKEIAAGLLTQLSDGDIKVRDGAAMALGEIAKTSPALIDQEIAAGLLTLLSDDYDLYGSVRASAAEALGEIAKTSPALIDQAVLLTKLSDGNGFVRAGAAGALREIAKTSPALIDKEIAAGLLTKLSDRDSDVRSGAAGALREIAKTSPALIDKEIAAGLLTQLSDDYSSVIASATQALGEIAKTSPALIDIAIAEELLTKLSDGSYSVRASAAEALGEIAKTSPALIDKAGLLTQLSDGNSDVRAGAAGALREIAKTSPALIDQYMVARLLTTLSDESCQVRAHAARALGEIAKTSPALIDQEIAAGLLTKLSDRYSDVKAGAAGAFREIAKTSPALIDQAKLLTQLSDESWWVRAEAAQALGEIAKTSPALIDQEIAAGLLTLLSVGNDPYGSVRAGAAKAIGEIAKTSPALIDKAGLLTLLSDGNKYVRAGAAGAFREIAKTSPAMIDKEIVAGLLTLLSDRDEGVRAGAAKALGEIAKTTPSMIDKDIAAGLLTTLSDGSERVRASVAKALGALTVCVNNVDEKDVTSISSNQELKKSFDEGVNSAIEEIAKTVSPKSIELLGHPAMIVRDSVAKSFFEILEDAEQASQLSVDQVLSIIAFWDDDDQGKKPMVEAAKKVLSKKLDSFDDAALIDLTARYEELMSLSKESINFMRKVYQWVLEDQRITVVEKDFMVKALSSGIESSITLDGRIILSGKSYQIDEESRNYVYEIVQTVLANTEYSLAIQYKIHQPLFVNGGSGIKVAASDIEGALSIVDASTLKETEWHMSNMCLSDHRRTEPTSKFILLERRNEFGYHEVYKISVDHAERYIQYPDGSDQESREEIFGEMPYEPSKPRYYSLMLDLEYAKGSALSKVTDLQEVDLLEYKWDLEWSNYIDQAREFKKYELLALDGPTSERTRSLSFAIDNKEGLEEIKSFMDRFDPELLESVVEKERLSQTEQKALGMIQSDPYKKAFYDKLRSSLYSIYIACSSISTGMVKNQQTGVTGKVGALLKGVGGSIPIAGTGIKILGDVLAKVDEKIQLEKVKRYAYLVPDGTEMAKLSEQVARKFALQFSNDNRPQREFSMIEKAGASATKADRKVGEKLAGTASPQDPDVLNAEADAENIAKVMIEGVFDHKEDLRAVEKFAFLVNIVDCAYSLTIDVDDKGPTKKESSGCCVVSYVTDIVFDNPLLNHNELVQEAIKSGVFSKLIDLGHDREIAGALLESAKEYGAHHVIDTIFSQTAHVKQITFYNGNSAKQLVNNDQLMVISGGADEFTHAPKFQAFGWLKSSYLKSLLYYREIAQFNSILQKYGISLSAEEALTAKGFRHIAFNLHPDKGGSKEDFAFAKNLQERFEQDIDVQTLLTEQIQKWQPVIHKTTVAFKGVDVALDGFKLYQEPTAVNAEKTGTSFVYLYSMYSDFDSISSNMNMLLIARAYEQEGFYSALKHIAFTAFMMLPTILSGHPYLSFASSLMLKSYIGYGVVFKAHTTYQEYGADTQQLKSYAAWKDASEWLSNNTGMAFFATKAQEYEVKLNTISIVMEKQSLQEGLKTENGEEFAGKVFEYIYEPFLKIKHDLLDAVTLKNITKEEAEEALKIKLFSIPSGGYDVCIQEDTTIKEATEYYCSHKSDESVHHISVNGNIIEINEVL